MSLGFIKNAMPPAPRPALELTSIETVRAPKSRATDPEEENDTLDEDNYPTRVLKPLLPFYLLWTTVAALYIPTGWIPDTVFVQTVGPGITQFLPAVVAYVAGTLAYGAPLGGAISTIVTLFLVVQLPIPTFMYALFISPLFAWLFIFVARYSNVAIDAVENNLQGSERYIEGAIHMLSLDVFGTLLYAVLAALSAQAVIVPFTTWFTEALGNGVISLADVFAPLAHLLVEPAKVMFLNTAINMNFLVPNGMQEVAAQGQTILFMLETNLGPGLGLLLAFAFFGPKNVRKYVLPSIILHVFGGIHEIYFFYILMHPTTILGVILGGMAGTVVFGLGSSGYTAPPSPGSIMALANVMGPTGQEWAWVGIALSVVISFLATWGVFRCVIPLFRRFGDSLPQFGR